MTTCHVDRDRPFFSADLNMYVVSFVILTCILMHVLMGEVVDRASMIPRTKTEHVRACTACMVDSFFALLYHIEWWKSL